MLICNIFLIIYTSIGYYPSRWEIDAGRDNSSSPTTTMISRNGSRISIGVRVVDERAAERRGNVGESTYMTRTLTRGFHPRKASSQTVHEYEQTDAFRRGKPRVSGYPQR